MPGLRVAYRVVCVIIGQIEMLRRLYDVISASTSFSFHQSTSHHITSTTRVEYHRRRNSPKTKRQPNEAYSNVASLWCVYYSEWLWTMTARIRQLKLYQMYMLISDIWILTVFFTLRAKPIAAQCIVIGPVSVCVCVCVCNGRAGGVCYHNNSKLRASIFTKLGL